MRHAVSQQGRLGLDAVDAIDQDRVLRPTCRRHQRFERRRLDAPRRRPDHGVGTDSRDPVRQDLGLQPPDIAGFRHRVAVERTDGEVVEVDEPQASDPAARQGRGAVRPDPAETHNAGSAAAQAGEAVGPIEVHRAGMAGLLGRIHLLTPVEREGHTR